MFESCYFRSKIKYNENIKTDCCKTSSICLAFLCQQFSAAELSPRTVGRGTYDRCLTSYNNLFWCFHCIWSLIWNNSFQTIFICKQTIIADTFFIITCLYNDHLFVTWLQVVKFDWDVKFFELLIVFLLLTGKIFFAESWPHIWRIIGPAIAERCHQQALPNECNWHPDEAQKGLQSTISCHQFVN